MSFASVTQLFNATTSMGRLMLNALLSFARFEREVTGKRILDKIAAGKRKGMWMGDAPPPGYDVENRRLAPNEHEAKLIRRIFRRFVELDSGAAPVKELKPDGMTVAPSRASTHHQPRTVGQRPRDSEDEWPRAGQHKAGEGSLSDQGHRVRQRRASAVAPARSQGTRGRLGSAATARRRTRIGGARSTARDPARAESARRLPPQAIKLDPTLDKTKTAQP